MRRYSKSSLQNTLHIINDDNDMENPGDIRSQSQVKQQQQQQGEQRKRRECSTTNNNIEQIIGPEELVRRETKAVMFLRALVMVVLIVVGALLSFGTYQFVAHAEEQTYTRDFDAVASRFTENFKAVILQSMWSAYSVGVAVTSNAALVNAAPNAFIPNFDELTKGSIQTFRLPQVYWAPLIQDRKEKQQFEAYVAKEKQAIMAAGGSPSKEPCYVCQSSSMEVGLPNLQVTFPIGSYSCGQIQWAALSGLIPKADCSYVVDYVKKYCNCIPLKSGNSSSSSSSTQNAYGVPPNSTSTLVTQSEIPAQIVQFHNNGTSVTGPGPYMPIWQVSPSSYWSSLAMRDLQSVPIHHGTIQAMMKTHLTILSESETIDNQSVSFLYSPVFSAVGTNENNPSTTTSNSSSSSSHLIGSIVFVLEWTSYLNNIVPLGSKGIHAVVENSCGQKTTFKSTGDLIELVGYGDLHDPTFSARMKQSSYDDYRPSQIWSSPYFNRRSSDLNCAYRITVYPTSEYRSIYITNKPKTYAVGVILIFVFTCIVFVTYDCHVARRQRKVMTAALQREEIVSSLFPDAVRGRLLNRGLAEQKRHHGRWSTLRRIANPTTESSTADDSTLSNNPLPMTGSIADHFPSVTVVFADISGFTAWSSEHDPSQVFHLLETVYHTFDKIARRYGVFKIETIGDCYVAVAGLPLPQPDHAIRVVKFAYECLLHMHDLIRDLETSLGSSTSALSIRIGIHSGPVIAGVLRGEKSRFQLFGDTMNTTSRVQTTGEINKIQISTATAKLLEEAQKSHWIEPRNELVPMKGKGLVQTYWVDLEELVADVDRFDDSTTSREDVYERWKESTRVSSAIITSNESTINQAVGTLVEFDTDLLMSFLEKLVKARNRTNSSLFEALHSTTGTNAEAVAGIELNRAEQSWPETAADELPNVRSQLHDFIATIAAAYRNDSFHNFEHASHVARSAAELVQSIITSPEVVREVVSPGNLQEQHSFSNSEQITLQKSIYTKTFGISSDPLMQFAIPFSALICDASHPMFSNMTMTITATPKESNCQKSKTKVKRHDALEFAWSLLMNGQYPNLVDCICGSEQEHQKHFRKLLVNAANAMAMPVEVRTKHWENAFGVECATRYSFEAIKMELDQKTEAFFISVMHGAQTSHYMQDWSTHQLWHARWLEERYLAYLRRDPQEKQATDPLLHWYEQEMAFFDQYIIPLANYLESCGAGTEVIRLATHNRHQWELEGRHLILAIAGKVQSDCAFG